MPDDASAGAAGPFLFDYPQDAFAAPDDACDLIMKGGVTSGVVYPYAILELARKYRFRSIGGTSAGAIAAAFAAAAEYARTVRGDPDGFRRLQARCETLPDILGALFQPTPRYQPLMRYLLRSQAGQGAGPWLWNLPLTFWGSATAGAAVGAAGLSLAGAGLAGVLLGAGVGLLTALGLRLATLVGGLGASGFGMCPGLKQPGCEGPALTDWLHAALQEIAFGDPAHSKPLTFGDLHGDGSANAIRLKMVTTNLSQHRPHSLPTLGMQASYSEADWRSLFPEPVLAFLGKRRNKGRDSRYPTFPLEADLPVLIAVRMSLSFPVLFQAVPLWWRDVDHPALLKSLDPKGRRVEPQWQRLWFTDGGISSNFPIHMFDAVLPSRPTFALSLEPLPGDAPADSRRVLIPSSASDGVGLPTWEVNSMAGFANGVLGSAKDWQDQLLARMPGQRERIAKVYLTAAEGGLNLTMPRARSQALMRYGQEVGARFAAGAFDFDEHRWRRALVAYEQLEKTVGALDSVWTDAGFGDWLEAYEPLSYKSARPSRPVIHERIAQLAALGRRFVPALAGRKMFPRPSGRLRIGPDF